MVPIELIVVMVSNCMKFGGLQGNSLLIKVRPNLGEFQSIKAIETMILSFLIIFVFLNNI